jgi:hypothetical protein
MRVSANNNRSNRGFFSYRYFLFFNHVEHGKVSTRRRQVKEPQEYVQNSVPGSER